MSRTEHWTRDGKTAVVEVTDQETVVVAYDLLAGMLRELGFEQEKPRHCREGS